MKSVGEALISEISQTSEFDKAVQDHYGGEYEKIKRISAEMELLEKANKANSAMGVAHSDGKNALLAHEIILI
jgi:hypothetical protein